MGIRLIFDSFADLIGRCEIATVRQAGAKEDYDEGAVVPVDDWQPLTREEADRFQASDATETGRLVELVRCELPLFGAGEHSRRDAAAELDPLDGRWPTELLGCVVNRGGLTTTTRDHSIDQRIGLHVDNFDRRPQAARHRSRRRLGLNLGPGPRYLLLGDRDIQEICQELYGVAAVENWPHTDDVRRYVAEGRPLRCLRIRLEQGDGYLAPTELLPHDGSTLGTDVPSTAAFWLGLEQPEPPRP
ncbi:hypothetical protein DP939_40365 [Spongiactinospora rosea]|uniref:Uncharacterized protein n=1 Tax=Spongiactinospora rosea TaxID=2248750 RepID=A0A366LLH6_9ACTN|nr:hypothetical protein [Spongiactinospora rosea]RBQ14520.1 hypothetical protein DP939_40365 [Spongiactinospora rosea]